MIRKSVIFFGKFLVNVIIYLNILNIPELTRIITVHKNNLFMIDLFCDKRKNCQWITKLKQEQRLLWKLYTKENNLINIHTVSRFFPQ